MKVKKKMQERLRSGRIGRPIAERLRASGSHITPLVHLELALSLRSGDDEIAVQEASRELRGIDINHSPKSAGVSSTPAFLCLEATPLGRNFPHHDRRTVIACRFPSVYPDGSTDARSPNGAMLKITLHDRARELRLKLEGSLCDGWVQELRQCWSTASSTTAGRSAVIDLDAVDKVDPEGQSLLREMYCQGVVLQAARPFVKSLIDEIRGSAMLCARPAGSR